jgi:hypothetical protein
LDFKLYSSCPFLLDQKRTKKIKAVIIFPEN